MHHGSETHTHPANNSDKSPRTKELLTINDTATNELFLTYVLKLQY